VFPFDFGFIPSTLGEDGDPLDIMVLMDAAAHVGCLIEVGVIGVIEAGRRRMGKRNRTFACSASPLTPTSTRGCKR
jgi:inorganic pyrophosphatase